MNELIDRELVLIPEGNSVSVENLSFSIEIISLLSLYETKLSLTNIESIYQLTTRIINAINFPSLNA